MTQRVVIVGAGISGLATAFHLQKRLPNLAITVLEAAPRPGGTVWTERRDGYQVELGANGFLDNKLSTINLCRQLGLADRLIQANDAAKHRYLFLGERLQPLPESLWSFLRSPLLSWRSKLRLLAERYRRTRPPAEEESVHAFVARRTNQKVADLFADALVTGIHAGDPKLLSMTAAFPRIVAMEREHGSIILGMKAAARERRRLAKERGDKAPQGSRLHSFREGLGLLIETLAAKLAQSPRYGSSVRSIERNPGGRPAWRITTENGEALDSDAVVLACSTHQQAQIVAGLEADLAVLLNAIPYAPAVVAALGYRQSDVPQALNGFGYVMPQGLRGDVLGAQWCSSIFPDRAPPDHVLIRLIAGGWHRPDVVAWDDDRLLHALRSHLAKAMHVQAAPRFQHVTRWPKAIPQYHVGHRARVAAIEEAAGRHPGLYLTGNALHGVALNDCTEQAEIVSGKVAAFLRSSLI